MLDQYLHTLDWSVASLSIILPQHLHLDVVHLLDLLSSVLYHSTRPTFFIHKLDISHNNLPSSTGLKSTTLFTFQPTFAGVSKRRRIMPPILTQVARTADALPLVATSTPTHNLTVSNEHQQTATKLMRSFVAGTPKQAIQSGNMVFYYMSRDNLCFLTLCEEKYPKRMAFLYLEDVADAILQEMIKEFGNAVRACVSEECLCRRVNSMPFRLSLLIALLLLRSGGSRSIKLRGRSSS
jgi:Regulated-SNARE-like domain